MSSLRYTGPMPSGRTLYAHRGASRELPENTLEAFRLALEVGADALELDVHPTRDGVFVVSHDPNGARMCNVAKRIDECTWQEVAGWDAGWGYVDSAGTRPHAGKGIRPARLEQVIDEFPEVALNVDVKEASSAALAPLLALLRAQRADERVLLTSFSWRTLRAIRGAGYPGSLGLCRLDVMRLVFSPELLAALCGFHGVRAQIPTRSGPFDLSRRALIEKCHRLGLAVDYWVVNDAAEAARLLRAGADGIITDDPRTIAGAFREPLR
jgi:glycerophosphoryl diester phosphodiesterase